MPHPFLALQEEYVHRLATLKITRTAAAEKRARELIKPSVLDHFVPVNQKLGIPIVWMVCSFNRESDCDFTRSPAQGDRWDEVSTHVPRGVGPFPSFEASAEWAYRHDGIEKNSFPWTFAYACYTWEEFNGFGPRNHGHVSGYVFAGTDQYDPPPGLGGKYVEDGVWSPTTVDRQLGCVPLAMMMIELEPSLAFVADVGAPAVVPPLPIVVRPPPIGVGGDPEGTGRDAAWIQRALNALRIEGTPLAVDGNYGRGTRNAVRAFQAAHGLDPDGLAGPLTIAALVVARGDV